MSELAILLLEITISVIASITVIMLISGTLKEALSDLCPTDKQARFWLAYTRTMLLISPILLALFINSLHEGDVFSSFRTSLIASLAGLLVGLIIIGRKMYIPVDRQLTQSIKDSDQ